MRVRVKAYGILRSLLGDQANSLDMSGHTLGDLINSLARKYGPKVKEELLDERGQLDFSYALFIRGERQNSLAAAIREGDEIVITNILGGGQGMCCEPLNLRFMVIDKIERH